MEVIELLYHEDHYLFYRGVLGLPSFGGKKGGLRPKTWFSVGKTNPVRGRERGPKQNWQEKVVNL